MNIQPNVGKLVVKLQEETGRSQGGIYMPASATVDGVKRAKVVAVGPTRIVDGQQTALTFSEGDEVLLDPLGATKLKVGGDDVLLVRVEDVLAKVL